MKKIGTLFLAMGLFFGLSSGASAIDFKARGQWIMSFDYGQHMRFTDSHTTGADRGEDEFEASQRVRLQLEAVASESLSGTAYFEIGKSFWGAGNDTPNGGAALGADAANVIRLKNAYLDWVAPRTDLKVRMGIQPMSLPGFTTGSNVFDDDTAGISLSLPISEHAALTAFWARPLNDNLGRQSDETSFGQGFLDNMDLFALVLPLSFDGVRLSPWVMAGGIGPNLFSGGDGITGTTGGTSHAYLNSGLFPAGGGRYRDGSAAPQPGEYATVWWTGLTGDITFWDPFRIAFDVNYGSVDWEGERWDRRGWLASLLLEYKTDWGTPGLVGWYASGDDGNPANGSERMPSVSVNNINNGFSNLAFNGHPCIGRESLVGRDMSGTWGIGVRLKDVSFVENLKHTLRVNLIGGTNSTTMAGRYLSDGGAGNFDRDYYDTKVYLGPNSAWMGMNPLYLTTEDHVLEIGFSTEWKMYENLTVFLDAGYLATWLDQSKSVWGTSRLNGMASSDSVADPWNINLSFVYAY